VTVRHRHVLVDTSVWIEPPSQGFTAHAEGLSTSILVLAELYDGLNTAPDALELLARRRRLQRIQDNYSALPVDLEVTEMYGALAQMVRSVGRKPAPRAMDLLIAATAARHRLPLLTRNAGDLKGLEAALTVVPID
jgi:predicted nucleic acid-binding protein